MQSERFAPISRFFTVFILVTSLILLVFTAFGDPTLRLWELHFNLYLLIPAVALAVSLILLGIMLRRPLHSEETLWLFVYLLLIVVVCLSEGLQKLSAYPAGAIFWSNFFTPALFLSPTALLFALTYTNRTAKRFNGLAAFIIVTGLAFIFFELLLGYLPYTQVKYLSITPWGWDFATHVPRITWQLNVVPFFWVLGLTGVAIGRLLSFRRHTNNPILRLQSLVYVYGVALPILAGAMFASIAFIFPHLGLPSMNSVASLVSAIILVYGVYRYHLTTVSPTQFSETILRLIQESVIVLDTNYRILYVNPKGETMLGISGTNLEHVSLTQFLTPDSARLLREADVQQLKHATLTIDQLDIVRSPGATPTPVRVTGSRLQLTDLKAHIVVFTDITTELQTRHTIEREVKVRTHELHQARANLIASISSLQQGFLLVNAKGIIELTNSRAHNFFDATVRDMVGQPLAALAMTNEWHPSLSHAVERVLAHGKASKLAITGNDGSFYQVYITPVVLEDHPLGATIVIEDVTEAKILDRSKDEFFSIASHELRTPLTAIRGNMSMAKDYFPEAMKDQSLNDLISDAHAASIRLIEIVNDFLDSSKLEQGKMAFNMRAITILPLITAVTGDLAALTVQQHNTIVLDASLNLLPPLFVDEARLRQILYNLFSNANKYTDHGTITLTGTIDGTKATLHIADTGKGISPENQKLLFHKFQQAGESILTRDNTKGTGLGLYISKLLATNMHGTIVLEQSKQGVGSVFGVVLRVAGEGLPTSSRGVN
jgi:PAS domain S-box-containing protein